MKNWLADNSFLIGAIAWWTAVVIMFFMTVAFLVS